MSDMYTWRPNAPTECDHWSISVLSMMIVLLVVLRGMMPVRKRKRGRKGKRTCCQKKKAGSPSTKRKRTAEDWCCSSYEKVRRCSSCDKDLDGAKRSNKSHGLTVCNHDASHVPIVIV